MAEPKTRLTGASVKKFLASVPDARMRADCDVVLGMMRQATRAEPEMWGPSIVGFGSRRLIYASGRELDWPVCAFSPRKQALTLYLTMNGFAKQGALLKKLGKHKTSKTCLYLGRLDEVHMPTLKALIVASVKEPKQPARAR